jgi:hypothetical protein
VAGPRRFKEEKRAAAVENPSVRRTVEGIAKRYQALAEKLEAARKKPNHE